MTTESDHPTDATPTEPVAVLDAERLDRIARLQARRADPTTPSKAPRRRRHPARNSRIAATALGVSAAFGLVTAYGVAAQGAGPELADAEPAVPARAEPIVIEVRIVDANGNPVASAQPTAGSSEAVASVPEAAATAAPSPQVRVLTAPAATAPAPAPVAEATTNGSR